jgi:adenine-specific DNA-methyltransferase
MTPSPIAQFMASLFSHRSVPEVALLDPGAGTGSLTAAFVEEFLCRPDVPSEMTAHAYELEPVMTECLDLTLSECRRACELQGVDLSTQVFTEDFILSGVAALQLQGSLMAGQPTRYTHCIVNPPYKKISSGSQYRILLRTVGIETTNAYAAFIALAVRMLADQGEIVAIIPRSFCNGPYFRPFRRLLFSEASLTHLHVFDTRNQAFKEDDVLQENVIVHAIRGGEQGDVTVTSSAGPDFNSVTSRRVDFGDLVSPDDDDLVLQIVSSDLDQRVVDIMGHFTHSLDDLGLAVCTGPVVDFRLRSDILRDPAPGARPLIYPSHIQNNLVVWPAMGGRKPNAIRETPDTDRWLMPNGWYTLTKRFSSKEERRRIVAAVHDPTCVRGERIGFENHLNVFHRNGNGLDPEIARGLALYLNTTLVDLQFRQRSGHTQVNASDLRMLRYPSLEMLAHLGSKVGDVFPNQETVDSILETETSLMADDHELSPTAVMVKVQEATSILETLGFPRAQINDRSAYTLLALINLRPNMAWTEASDPRVGITPIMDFVRDHYGRSYAPNSRETFRKETMHQFVGAGLAVQNPDKPDRPTNSPKWCYQIEPTALALLSSFGTEAWESNLEAYMSDRQSLAERYGAERDMQRQPLTVDQEIVAQLSPGPHSKLIIAIIEEFAPCFAPGSRVLYVGDTGNKTIIYDEDKFLELGLVSGSADG